MLCCLVYVVVQKSSFVRKARTKSVNTVKDKNVQNSVDTQFSDKTDKTRPNYVTWLRPDLHRIWRLPHAEKKFTLR